MKYWFVLSFLAIAVSISGADTGCYDYGPSNPLLGTFVGDFSCGALTADPPFVYVNDKSHASVRVLDFTDCERPFAVAGVDVDEPFAWLVREGQRLYAVGEGGVRIVDISDPLHPELVARHIVSGLSGFAVRDGLALFWEWRHGLRIWDFSNI
jgi:hypothetical protein